MFEELRAELGYADYLGALQRYRVEHARDPRLQPTCIRERSIRSSAFDIGHWR